MCHYVQNVSRCQRCGTREYINQEGLVRCQTYLALRAARPNHPRLHCPLGIRAIDNIADEPQSCDACANDRRTNGVAH